jgi:hypothetical protein
MIVMGALGFLVLFGMLRMWGGRKRWHIIRKNNVFFLF